MNPVDLVLSRLKNVRRKGDGYEALCPAHDDHHTSLSVSEGDDGRALLFCQVGCQTPAIVAGLKLEMADLFRKSDAGKSRIVAEYSYQDERGELLYQSLRMDPKDFRQRKPDGSGKWAWKLNGVRRVLYRLPELLKADPAATVYIPEGEKDVNCLCGFGLVATCNVGGAGKWRDDYNNHLRGRNVVILGDNDDAGRKHAVQVAGSLQGIAASVKVIELPGLPPKGDVSDWLDAGNGLDELQTIVAEAPEWEGAAKKSVVQIVAQPIAGQAPGIEHPEGRSEIANAKRLVEAHGQDILWCDDWNQWLVFDGSHWARDRERRIESMMKGVVDAMWQTIANSTNNVPAATIGEMVRFAKSSGSANAIRNAVYLARSEPGVAVLPDRFDRQPMLLNVANGTIDLATNEIRKAERSDLITKRSPVAHDPAADCPLWLAVVDRVMGGNPDLISYLQRAAGYSATGIVREHALFFAYGRGANGKSTILNRVIDTLGPDYAITCASEMFLARKHETHSTERTDLAGKRFVATIEADDGKRLAESFVKSVTGGDRIRARRMKENTEEFAPTCKLWIAANHKPVVKGDDDGIWRRIRLIPFTVSIPLAEQDPALSDKLQAELPGILNWILLGCLDYLARGLDEPAEVLDATAEYRSESDILGQFLDECCEADEYATTPFVELFDAYVAWSEKGKRHVMSKTVFGLRLEDRGVRKRRGTGGKWFRDGIRLVTSSDLFDHSAG